MPKKESARGGRRNEAAARNGRTVGRPTSVVGKPLRFTVTLDKETVDVLKSINENISAAIRTLARRSKE